MAFDFNFLSNTGGTAPAPIIYTYLTSDTKLQMLTAGYFNSGFTKLKVDDLITVVNDDFEFWLRIISVSKASVTVRESMASTDFFTEVGKGNVPGHSFQTIVGHNPSVSNIAFDDLWGGGGNMTLPTTGEELEIASDNAADTAAGTGARTVLISTLDTSMNVISTAPVTMNGITPVTIPGGAVHFRMHHLTATSGGFVLTAGSSESNVGKLTIRVSGSGSIRSVIMPTVGKTEDWHVAPPAGFSIFGLRNLLVWPKNESGDITLTLKARTADSSRISTGIIPIYQNPTNIIFTAKNRGTSALDRALRVKSLNLGAPVTVVTEYLVVDDNFL